MDDCVRYVLVKPKLDIPMILKKIHSQNNSNKSINTTKEYFPYVERFSKSNSQSKSNSLMDGNLKIYGKNKNIYEIYNHESTLKHSDGKFTIKGMLKSERKDLQNTHTSSKIIKTKPSQCSVKRNKSFDNSWSEILKKTSFLLRDDKPKTSSKSEITRKRLFSQRKIKPTSSPYQSIDHKLEPPSITTKSSKFHSKYPEIPLKHIKSEQTSTHDRVYDSNKSIISIETKIIKKTLDVKMNTNIFEL